MKFVYLPMKIRRRPRGLTTVEYAVAGGILVAVGAVAFITLGDAVGASILALAGRVG